MASTVQLGVVEKIGGWREDGAMDDDWIWRINGPFPEHLPFMFLSEDGRVFLVGIEITPWTEARRKAMGLTGDGLMIH